MNSSPLLLSPASADSGAASDLGTVPTSRLPISGALAAHPFLSGLKPEYLRHLEESAVRVSCRADEFLFREGEPANRFYLIESGRVALEAHLRDEAPVEVQILGPGEVVGWSWLFPPCQWNFDARCTEPVSAVSFFGTRLRDLCDQDHDFGYEMMRRMTRVVIQRLQTTRQQLLQCRR
jgi:CRP-like cAMP-binding protein